MKLDIYKSRKLRNAYLSLPDGRVPEECVPKSVLARLGELSHFRSVELDARVRFIAADPEEVIDDVEKQGFHVQGAEDRTMIPEFMAAMGGSAIAASFGLGLGLSIAVAALAVGMLIALSFWEDAASLAKWDRNHPAA